MFERHRFKVLEVCEDLHSGANGSLQADRMFFQERYDWLAARADTWFPSRCEFDVAVHNLVDLALFEAIAAMPWLAPKCGSLLRTVSSDPCPQPRDGVDDLCSGCREFKAMCDKNDGEL